MDNIKKAFNQVFYKTDKPLHFKTENLLDFKFRELILNFGSCEQNLATLTSNDCGEPVY